MKVSWEQNAKTLVGIIIGSLIFAVGIDGFIVPHKLVSGGISGVALVLYYVTGVQIGTINFLLNIPILYAAYRWLGRWYMWITFIGTIVCSLAINALSFLSSYEFTTDVIAASILGGLLCGLGLGLVYRVGGNTGGLDPIAFIIRKYWGLQLGNVVFAINCVVLIVAATVVGINAATITLISLYLSAVVTNKIVIGFSQRKCVYIISYDTKSVCNCIIHQIGRGATILHGEGAYTGQDKQVVLVVVSLMQLVRLKAAVQQVDPNAFMFVTDAAEVVGQGFTMPIQAVKPPQAVVDEIERQASQGAQAEQASQATGQAAGQSEQAKQ